MNDFALLIGRWALAAIFVISGANKFLGGIDGVAAGIAAKGLPSALALAIAAAAVEIIGGLLIVLGWQTRVGCVLLIVFTVVASYFFHDFWAVAPEQYQAQFIQFMKNVAMIGGLFILYAAGPGRLSIDSRG